MINNLKLEFGEKSLDYLNGQPYRTRVVLKNDDGAYYPIFFEPDAIEKTDAELYQMALDVVYQKNSYQRAESEKFDEYDGIIKEIKKVSDKVDETIKIVSTTTLEIGNMVYDQQDILNQLLERMNLKVNEDGILVDKIVEVEGGE
ncbi:DUF1366 domain-containing protein [Streptococcus minor]|uniref:DUF1366 domain-containing protein n=1 Tax=Streptococcus minor TaxID=229549 RepID=UPI0003627C04|nr:DUF1366 domain-containing protein [Streptococcus minor]